MTCGILECLGRINGNSNHSKIFILLSATIHCAVFPCRLYADNVRALMAQRLGAKLSDQGLKEQQMLKQEGVCVDWTGCRVIHKQPKMKNA